VTVATTRRLETSGGRLAVLDVGEGPPVVLLHGYPLSSSVWRRFVPMLAGAFRVIAFDLLGAGDSDAAPDAPLDLAAQAGYVREGLEALGVERCAVLAHGEGGGVAQLLALDGFPVEAMVLVDPIAPGARPVEPEVAAGYAAPFGDGGGASDLRTAAVLDPSPLAGAEARMANWVFPVFLLWGEDDPVYPVELAERLNDAIPSSSLALLPGCGHYPTEEAPETVAPLVTEYLRARYLKAPHAHAADKEGVVLLQLERRPPWLDADDGEEEP
jgi:2-hydroxymuconate-semialdehyde hydrolase